MQHGPHHGHGHLEVRGHGGQVRVQLLGKGQHGVALVDQVGADRAEAVRALRRPCLQFGDHEVVQRTALGVARPGHRQDVVPQPADQRGHVVGQGHGGGRGRAGRSGASG